MTEKKQRRRLRKVLIAVLAAVITPALFFLALEGVLRAVGYGHPTGMFVKRGQAYINNVCFGWRFFPRSIARKPMPITFPANKPDNGYRIFVLGASAAQGFPQPDFGFSRILEVLLREQFPEIAFDVVNVAVTAINSHVVVEIARDCAERDPDLFIVLLGNNEVIGPYGPTFTFGSFSGSRRAIRLSLWAKSTRVGQWVGQLAQAIRDDPEPSEWKGMRTFLDHQLSPDDPRLQTVYKHFRANLTDICRVAQDADAQVLLATVPVNLRDCAPFGSAHGTGLSDGDLTRWTGVYEEGVRRQQEGDFAGAVQAFLAAEELDDHYADLHFRLGRCYLALDDPDAAGERFAMALHWDTLRFRADAPINETIRQVAGERKDRGVALIDAERLFADRSAPASPGSDLFYEHVHFNYDGQYFLARAMFDRVVSGMPQARRAGQSQAAPPSAQRCAEMLALTDWSRRRNLISLARLVAAPPFTGQLTNAETRQRIGAELRRLRARTTRADLAAFPAVYERAIRAAPEDYWLHHQAAQLAMSLRDDMTALAHLRKTLSLVPANTEAYLHLGMAYLRLGNRADAEATFEMYLKETRSTPAAYRSVVEVCTGLQLFDQAEAYCRRGLARHVDNAVLLNILGETLYGKGRHDQAIDALRQAVQIDPEYALAHANLGVVLVAAGRTQQGLEQLSLAIEKDPILPRAHFSLGSTQVQMGQPGLGFSHLAQAVQLDSDNAYMAYEFATLLQRHGNVAMAVHYFREALSINSEHVMAAGQLAWALATSSDEAVRNPAEALQLAHRSVELTKGRSPQAWMTLAAAYAADGQFDRAIETANRALAESDGQQGLVQQVQRHLAKYRRGESIHQGPSSPPPVDQ